MIPMEPVWVQYRCCDTGQRCERCGPVESAIGITSQQSTAIEQLYEDSLPAQRHAGENVVELTAQVATRVRLGEYDDELLRLTAELVKARWIQCELRRQMLERASGPLSPQQRTKLARFIAEKGVME